MKYFMMSADARGEFDPPGWDVVRFTPGRTEDKSQADVIFLVSNRHPMFRFNERLHEEMVGKPWVFFNWTENGWDWNQQVSHFYGKNTEKFFGDGYNEHWRAFDKFIQEHPPILTFQRELLERDRSEKILPLEYTGWLPESGSDTKDEFRKRPISALFNWGRSSESRMYMHAAFFSQAPAFGYDVISEWSHIEKAIKENISGPLKMCSVHAPHFARIDVREVQKFCRMSQIGVIMNGAGVKTFRDAECAQDLLMARPYNLLAWTYPWDETNSIVLPDCQTVESAQKAIKVIMDSIMRPDIYDIYMAGQDNARRYRHENYLRQHVQANVEKAL